MSKAVNGSVRSKRRYKPLVDLCIKLIMKRETYLARDVSAPKIKVIFKDNKPEWWPDYIASCENTYYVLDVLKALYEQKLSDYSDEMILEKRKAAKQLLKDLDNWIEGVYNE